MNRLLPFLMLVPMFLLMEGCKNPFDRTHDPDGGPTGSLSAGQLTVFNNELSSGGGAFLYPGSDNHSVAFDDRSNSLSQRSIRYAWNGQISNPTGSGYQYGATYIFAGFSLMHVPQQTTYETTPGRDLRAAGYTRISFYARGELTTYNSVKIEAGGPTSACMTLSTDGTVDECSNGRTGRLTASWQQFVLPITSAQQTAVKDLLKATFVFNNPIPGNTNPGQGGVLFLDKIFYQP